MATILGPAVLAAACYYGDAQRTKAVDSSSIIVRSVGSLCAGLSLVLGLGCTYSFCALRLARPKAPFKKKISASSRKVSLVWSASDDFEDFAPLLALKQLDFTGENITGALVQELRLDLEATLRAGSHEPRPRLNVLGDPTWDPIGTWLGHVGPPWGLITTSDDRDAQPRN